MIEFITYTFYLADHRKPEDRIGIELGNLRKALNDFYSRYERKPDSISLTRTHPLLLIKGKLTTFLDIPIKINGGVGINQIWLERNTDNDLRWKFIKLPHRLPRKLKPSRQGNYKIIHKTFFVGGIKMKFPDNFLDRLIEALEDGGKYLKATTINLIIIAFLSGRKK